MDTYTRLYRVPNNGVPREGSKTMEITAANINMPNKFLITSLTTPLGSMHIPVIRTREDEHGNTVNVIRLLNQKPETPVTAVDTSDKCS